MKKKHITLEFRSGLAVYQVTKLVNLATFTVNSNIKMIGSTLDCREAEQIASDRHFDVTITQAKG